METYGVAIIDVLSYKLDAIPSVQCSLHTVSPFVTPPVLLTIVPSLMEI